MSGDTDDFFLVWRISLAARLVSSVRMAPERAGQPVLAWPGSEPSRSRSTRLIPAFSPASAGPAGVHDEASDATPSTRSFIPSKISSKSIS